MMTVGPPTHLVSYDDAGYATCICGWRSRSEKWRENQGEWIEHLQEAMRLAKLERFEYRMELIPGTIDVPSKIIDWLNEFGADGWELVFFGSRACILKRRRM